MIYIAIFGWLLTAMPAIALDITGIHTTRVKDGERISIHASRRVDSSLYLADHAPPRVVVDMPPARWKVRNKSYTSTLIKTARMEQPNTQSSRLVFELNTDAFLRNVHWAGNKKKGYALEFELVTAPAKKDKQSISQFQPIEKPVIIIDPGHGGQDPGTSGVGGMKEKKITLRFAEALKEALMKSGRYKVVLTRSDDRYLFLKERVKIAREAHGDLFISLHADSAPSRNARGLSVYTISEKSSDKEAEALAAKENKADVIGGIDLSGTSADVADILIDLAERETRGKSARFAKLVTQYLSREVHLLSNTHRYAGFAVLKAPDIPSILVEVGFLSSPSEEKQLDSDSYRRKVAAGLSGAVDAYFAKRK